MLLNSDIADMEALRTLTRDAALTCENEWRRCNFDEIAFPDIALPFVKKLVENAPPNALDFVRILCAHGFLESANFNFSDGQIPLFRSSRFTVDLLLWMEGTTSIHQHGFSGAFGVFSGTSLHSEYGFRNSVRINSRFYTGEIHLSSLELLKRGDVRKITSGKNFIHSLFHIETPSLSVVVRTLGEPDAKPQLDYRKPYFAIDPTYFPGYIEGAAKAIRVLSSGGKEGIRFAVQRMHKVYAQQDIYLIFRKIALADASGDLLDTMLEALAECDKDFCESLHNVLFKEFVVSLLVKARRTIIDPEVRVFLALVMNLDDRQSIFKALELIFDIVNVPRVIQNSIQALQCIDGMAVDESILGPLTQHLLGKETDCALPSALIFHPAYAPLLN
ncbi:hypothetical protein [Burkholderia glumae]